MGPDEVASITGTWDYSTLPANVRIGSGCFIERRESFRRFRSVREPGVSIGDRVLVYTWSEFSVEPEGLVEVGDESILVGAIFMCAQQIRVGRRVVVSYNVTIADSDFHPRDPDLRIADAVANAPGGDLSSRPPYESRPVEINDDVWIGIGAIVLKGVTIGAGARIGAGSVVTADVAPGAVVAGNPARTVEEGS